MLKGLGNIASMLKQAQEMQGKMSEARDRLAQVRVEGTAGGGMVTVAANAQMKILDIKVEDVVLTDREMLEELMTAAVNQALDKAREAAAEEMQKVTGSMDVPGLGDALDKLGMGGGPAG